MATIDSIQSELSAKRIWIVDTLLTFTAKYGARRTEWRRRSRARRALAQIDARDFADAGISAGNAAYEIKQPFWRPLRNLR